VFNEPESIAASPAYNSQVHREGAHIGRLVQAPDDAMMQYKTDDRSELIIKFDHPDTVDYFVTFLDKYEVPENPRDNLLIVGREYIQFFDWSVDMDGLTVTFTTLFRGKFGTGSYMGTHVEGEHCFLYTPETIKSAACNPLFTKRQQVAKVFIRRAAFAGIPVIDWAQDSDAGSARPYGPSPAVYTRNRQTNDYQIHRRRSVQLDYIPGSDNMPSEWKPDVRAASIYIEGFPERPTIEDFEAQFVRFQGATDAGNLYADEDTLGPDFEDSAEQWFLVVEINGDIWGHPTITRVPGATSATGGGGCDAGGEGYNLGEIAGCIDGALDFGGMFQGPNWMDSFGLGLTPEQQACFDGNINFYADQYALGYDAGYSVAYFAGTC